MRNRAWKRTAAAAMLAAFAGGYFGVVLNGHAQRPEGTTAAAGPRADRPASALGDAEIRERMIGQSLAGYSGPCPCPYNHMRNGALCGERSAWSKPGGAEPLCYASDISDAVVRQYRAGLH